MTPANLQEYLNKLVKNQLQISTMIWGAPGIGKSSIVAQVALENNLNFIDLRLCELLHKLNPQSHAWASPRTWEMASKLHSNNIDITPAVGEGASVEFNAFVALYKNLPDINGILSGKGQNISFPNEASTRYATTIALAIRGKNADETLNAFRWLIDKASNEWIQLFAVDLMRIMREKGQLGALSKLIKAEKQLQTFFKDFQNIIGIL
jgi:hypothetical protein